MSRLPVFALLLSWLLLPIVIAGADDAPAASYKGAAAVLKELATATPVPTPEHDSSEQLRKDLVAASSSEQSLPPDEAAAQWLDLEHRLSQVAAIPPKPGAYPYQPLSFADVFRALPPPSAWAAIETKIIARHPKGDLPAHDRTLLLLMHYLGNDHDRVWKDLSALKTALQQGGGDLNNVTGMLNGLTDQLAATSTPSGLTLEAIRHRIASRPVAGEDLALPDMVTQLGAQQASALIKQALLNGHVLNIRIGTATRKLAAALTLQYLDRIPEPQWNLALDINSMQLYEALYKKFGTAKSDESDPRNAQLGRERINARGYYLMGLIAAHRTAEAVTLATRISSSGDTKPIEEDSTNALEAAGHTSDLFEFLNDLMTKHPDLDLWDTYIRVAAGMQESEAVVKLVRKQQNRHELSATERRRYSFHLYQALLAADRVDEGAAVLKQLIASTPQTVPNPMAPTNQDPAESHLQFSIQLATLGKLLNHPDWTAQGLAAMREDLPKVRDDLESTMLIATTLEKNGDGPEAEKVILEAMKREKEQPEYAFAYLMAGGRGSILLPALAELYSRAGRYDDVVTLLDAAPGWGAKDISELLGPNFNPEGPKVSPLGYLAARALSETGHKTAALGIVRALLHDNAGFDPAYQLLVDLQGQNAIPFLDLLFSYDQFEERPLIWKAHLLRLAGKLEEAEAVARQAIAIDPSDGEEPHGDRMRAYGELADIREARGDAKEAAGLRAALKAIRTSEGADDLYAAGLLRRAVDTYTHALTFFSGAYCIQSRLAIQLAAQGRMAEAAAHYRRAYELMPDSFGRMESHCFGCEGVFNGERAATIAHEVFNKLVAAQPKRPQGHYLLGYLLEDEGDTTGALASFQKAVALDPDYINAWKHIQELSRQMTLPPGAHDSAVFNLIRLDPEMHHVRPDFTQVVDLKGAWSVLAAAKARRPAAVSGNYYPLAASSAMIEKEDAALRNAQIPIDQVRTAQEAQLMFAAREESATPADFISTQKVVAVLIQMIEYETMTDGQAAPPGMGVPVS